MSDFDDRWLNVDFLDCPEYVFGDLGMPCFADFGPSFEDLYGVMSDADIDAAIDEIAAYDAGLDKMVTRILNQKNEGSCVANAYTQANQILQAKQRGRENVVQLSPISLYKRIGRSPNSGATVSDGVAEMNRRGILPLDTPENRAKYGEHVMPATGFYEKFPAGWEDTAKKFAGLEHHVVRSVEGLLSALCQGHPVVVGRQGHSICYCRPMRKGGNRVVKYANSWGDWGDGGYGYDSQKLISQSANWAAAVRSVVVPTT